MRLKFDAEEREGNKMTRQEAETRVQMWLAASGLITETPSYGQASKLAFIIDRLTDRQEVYTTCFIYDVWRQLLNE